MPSLWKNQEIMSFFPSSFTNSVGLTFLRGNAHSKREVDLRLKNERPVQNPAKVSLFFINV